MYFVKLPHKVLPLMAILVLAGTFGCGANQMPTYPASGKVSFSDGTPVTAGRVEFRSEDAKIRVPVRAEIQEDGTFQLGTYEPGDGAAEGKYKAIVNPSMIYNKQRDVVVPAVKIHPRFGSYRTSGIAFDVTRDPEQNQFSIIVEPPRN